MIENPDFTRKSLVTRLKARVEENDNSNQLTNLHHLKKAGQMMRNTLPDVAKLWGNALQHLVDEHMKFALNSTLPHNANLYLWKRKVSEACPLANSCMFSRHELQMIQHPS